jgi:hypothetical protein
MDFSPLKLPTDNLYKFLALGGLVSFLFSISLPFFAVRDLEAEAVGLEPHAARMVQRAKDQEELATKFQEETAQQKTEWERKLAEAATRPEPERQQLKAEIAEWKKSVDAKAATFRTSLDSLFDTIAKVDALNKQIEVRTADLDRILSYWPLGFWGGIAMTLVGFSGWFWRVQRHQDALLRAQVREFQTNPPSTKAKPHRENAGGK